jgi:TetR/AcrR family transcriptional regulator
MSHLQDSEKIKAIIEAARKRFGHYGLAKTTMTEIATDIGVSKASLYYYFPDKENLFIEVIRNEMEVFFEEMDKASGESIPGARKLNHFVELRFVYFKQFLNLGKLEEVHFDSVKPGFMKLNEDFLSREKKIIEEIILVGIKEREFEKIDAVLHADLFVSLLRSIRVMIIKERDSFKLTPQDYETIKNYQANFTSVYVKGISRAKN